MKKIILYYFTGSGNTLLVTNRVKENFEKNGYDVTVVKMEEVKHVDTSGYDYIGLLFPVAIQSTYPIVWQFMVDLPTVNNQKIFMIDTMSSFSGGIVGPLKLLLKGKGYDCVGAKELKMTSSMSKKSLNNHGSKRKNDAALKEASQFVNDLLKGQTSWKRVPVLSDLMRSISKSDKIWLSTSQKKNINHKLCVNCKICIRNCPVNALTSVGGKIIINHQVCNSCMRCVHVCPKDAFLMENQKVYRY